MHVEHGRCVAIARGSDGMVKPLLARVLPAARLQHTRLTGRARIRQTKLAAKSARALSVCTTVTAGLRAYSR